MAMKKEWKRKVLELMARHNVRHRCTTEHSFIHLSSPQLFLISGSAKAMANTVCINHVPMLMTTRSFSRFDFALVFLWDQPVEDIEKAMASLMMRKPSSAILCVCWVSKNVRDLFPHASEATNMSVSQMHIARFITRVLEHNVNV